MAGPRQAPQFEEGVYGENIFNCYQSGDMEGGEDQREEGGGGGLLCNCLW